jgi:hypothetical protein
MAADEYGDLAMKRTWMNKAVLKVLGLLLVVAAVLKGHQLLTEPVANSSIWTYRPVLERV